ncbi:MAG TPA: hypothetical protein VML55_11910 [Planctomycetaceae bacterium]|nr:hypothetical protein [Planctomycetaceae bacterium]
MTLPASTARFAAESTVMTAMGVAYADRELALECAADSLVDKSREGVSRVLRKECLKSESDVRAAPDESAWQAIARPVLGYFYAADRPHSECVSSKALRLQTSAALFGLSWGLTHVDVFERHFEAAADSHAAVEQIVGAWPWSGMDGFVANCLFLIERWESEYGPLPPLA